MARSKTVHLPTPEEVNTHQRSLTFPSAKIAEFGRVDPESGWIKFRCSLPKDIEKLFQVMGWDIPGEKTVSEDLEGKLKGGHLILTPKLDKDELLKVKSPDGKVNTDAEVDIEFEDISSFKCLRLELEGRKGKGFRRELRFEAKFKCEDGAANLESYMMRTSNARGSLKVTYYTEPVQTEIKLDDEQITFDDKASKMADAAEVGTLASARQMGEKRGRLADAN